MAQLNVEIPDDLQKRLKLTAVERETSVRVLVAAALIELLDDLEKPDAKVKA